METQLQHDDGALRLLFVQAKTIAVVGLSYDETKASHEVSAYMKSHGYRIIPVNPRPGVILGEAVYQDLGSIPVPVDIVNVFRPSEVTPDVVRAAIPLKPKVIWLQLGIANDEAAKLAADAGIPIVMDKCIKIEHRRLLGEKLIDPSVI